MRLKILLNTGVAVAALCAGGPGIALLGQSRTQYVSPSQSTSPTVTTPLIPKGKAPPMPVTPSKTGPTTAQESADAIAAYKVQQLVDMTEARYQSGVEDYRAGKLDAARSDFDAAVDMMLTSGMDLQANQQLNDEFESVVDRVNSLEMEALKQGNGFSPHEEAPPAEAGENITFTSNPTLTAKLNTELQTTQSDMPLMVNEYVAGFINYFTNSETGHAHLVHSLERAGKYKDMIQNVLRQEGVPQDMIYLAVTESGFQPQAYNARSGAGGMWQFMPFSSYGLDRNGWFDERFDPEKSTRAYARYIKELYNQFGDWYLAMAAYNWGPGNIQKAVQRTGYADFWELYRRNVLPKETKNYVPSVIAAIIMAKNAKQYGLSDLVPEPEQQSDTVTVDYGIDLRLVADVTGATLTDIVALNPSLLRMSTPKDMSFDLHLPAGTAAEFQKRVAAIPEEKRDSWRFHVVTDGETLGGVAEAFHVKVKDLAQVNDLDIDAGVNPGDELAVPVAAASREGLHTASYKVRSGDTLVTVADRFGVTVSDLRRWNHLTASGLTPGRTIKVEESVHLAPMGRSARRRGRSSSRGKSSAANGKRKPATGAKTSASNARAEAPKRRKRKTN